MNQVKINRKGFNLVELLVVMAIIAVLVGILIYTINAARLQQRNTQRRSIANTAKAALEAYYAKCKIYPVTPGGGSLTTLLTTNAGSPCTAGAGGVQDFATGIDAANSEDPSEQADRLCYARVTRTSYKLYVVTEPPSTAPTACNTSADFSMPTGAEDFSVR